MGKVDLARTGAGNAKEVSRCTCCVPGPDDYVFQPLGAARITEEGASGAGRGCGGVTVKRGG